MKKYGKFVIFCVLLVFLACLSVVNAAEASDNTTNIVDDSIQSMDTQEHHTQEIINTEDVTKKDVSKKESTTENTKTAKQVSVNNYQQLLEEVENAKKSTEQTYTINLNKGSYDVTNTILWESTDTSKKLVINGNNNVISGKNRYTFINSTSNNALELNNIILKNFKTAIHSNNHISLSNCILANNTGEDGGAIKCFIVTLTNCILANNTGINGSAISCGSGTFTNCTFVNNTASDYGGAIYASPISNIMFYNCTLANNTASKYGGAVYTCTESSVTVSNSTLANNTAENGGAIYAYMWNYVTVSNSTLANNTASKYGGAIYSEYTAKISNSTLSNNSAEKGSAIYNTPDFQFTLSDCTVSNNKGSAVSGSGTFTNCTFVNNTGISGGALSGSGTFTNCTLANNTANIDGGAIYVDEEELSLDNCTLANNTAENGGAIYCDFVPLFCSNTVMINNHANYRGGAIYYNYTSFLNEKYMTFLNNSAKEGNNIYYCTLQTRIELNDTIGVYRDQTSIIGKFVDSNNGGIPDYNLSYSIDGITGQTRTNSVGIFNISLKLNETGTKNVYVEFKGNNICNSSNITKKLTVLKRNTTINMEEIENSIGTITVRGTLTDYTNTKLGNVNVVVSLNNVQQKVLTDANGIFTTTFTVTKTGQNVLSIVYKGNKNYEGSNYTTTLNLISGEAVITFFDIKPTTYHNVTNISGKVSDKNGNTYENIVVPVIINDEIINAKTDNDGLFTINYLTKKAGVNNVTTIDAKDETPLKTFTVNKRTTQIIIDQIEDTNKNQTITITGKLLDQFGLKLGNVNIYITINTETYNILTNKEGIYTLDYKTEIKGLNNVTINYKGNSNYEKTTQKTTFHVEDIIATKITVNSVGTVQRGSVVSITGKYTDINGNNLRYTPIIITINGQAYKNSTDANGIYTFSYKTTTIGTNNVSVSYPGNSRYSGATAKATFNVVDKIATKITVNSVGTVQKGGVVLITGKYTDINGNNLRYTPILITINGQTYKNSTDANGIYTYTYKATTIGTNNVSVSYPGNSRYSGATAKTTFQVTDKIATKITVNSIGTVQKGNTIKITRKYTDINGNNLRYTPIVITINGQTFTNSTDANGIYTYVYKTTTSGTNNVTVSYPGNSRYSGATAKTTFQVK